MSSEDEAMFGDSELVLGLLDHLWYLVMRDYIVI